MPHVHDHVESEVNRNGGKYDHRESARCSRQVEREIRGVLCETETESIGGALSWLGSNIFLSTLFSYTLSLFPINMRDKLQFMYFKFYIFSKQTVRLRGQEVMRNSVRS